MPEISAISAGGGATKRPEHQSVYENLRQRILFGELAPGQPVTIQGIAEELKAGMTPVREAIRRLTSDGALTMMGNRRVTVPELTASCTEQLVFMRKVLEPELAARATSRISADVISALDAEDRALNIAIEKGDIGDYLSCNYRFHAMLYRTADAPIMAATADRLWLRFGPSLRVVCGRYGTMNLPDKHADLLQALLDKDVVAARRAMLEDVEQGMRQIAEALTDGT
jgi:DNA-binding GntR family transcriptional regulator